VIGRIRRLSARDRRAIDIGIAALMTGGGVAVMSTTADIEGPMGPNLAAVVAITVAGAFRRQYVLQATAVAVVAWLALLAFLTPPFLVPFTTFTLMLLSYSAGTYVTGRRSRASLALIVAAIFVATVVETPEDIVFPTVIFGIAPYVGGRILRNHTLLTQELAEKAEMAAHLGDAAERDAVNAERVRVARELHDVLAHELSVMVIQAQGARRLVERNPEAAAEAADLIGSTGRDALTELRRRFGPVRHGEGEDLDGQPGLGRLDALISRARAAGLPVTLRTEGDPVELSPGLDIAAYRIIQEALTNSYKHGGGAEATVTVTHWPHLVMLEVVDDGRGTIDVDAQSFSGGHGLVGMRERVEVYGGTVEAGPRQGGGFRVVARLPVQRGKVAA
jgi:signal transduction histidine kinase